MGKMAVRLVWISGDFMNWPGVPGADWVKPKTALHMDIPTVHKTPLGTGMGCACVTICNTYQSLLDLLPMIPDQTHRPQKHPGGSKQKDQIRQPELRCKTQMLSSVCHHIYFTNLYIYL